MLQRNWHKSGGLEGWAANPLTHMGLGLLSAGRDRRVDPFQAMSTGYMNAQQLAAFKTEQERKEAEEKRKKAEAERKDWEHKQKVELSERLAALRNPMAMAHGALQGPPQAGESPLMREGADPTLALLSQVDPVLAAKMSIQGGPTSAIQNAYAVARMNGRETPTKEDYLMANAPGSYSPDTIKLFDENFIYDPITGKTTAPDGSSAEDYIEKGLNIGERRARGEAYGAGIGASQADAAARLAGMELELESSKQFIEKLRSHPGRKQATGNSSVLNPIFIVGETRDFLELLKTAEGKAFMSAYESLKGGGTITEVETAQATKALANLDTSQSEPQFLEALDDLEEALVRGFAKMKASAGLAAEDEKPSGRRRWNPEKEVLE
jgi:hypothetical protein